MADDSWIEGIVKDRQAAIDRETLEKKALLEKRRNYEARSADFWNRISGEIARVVSLYHQKVKAPSVEAEANDRRLVLRSAGCTLTIVIDHDAQEVTAAYGTAITGGKKYSTVKCPVVAVNSGELVFSGKNGPLAVDAFVASVMETFLREANNVPA